MNASWLFQLLLLGGVTIACSEPEQPASALDAAHDISENVDDSSMGPDALDAPEDSQAMDAPDVGPNPCMVGGGLCIPAARSTSPATPGLTLMCPQGSALYDGRTTFLGPGSDLVFGPVNGGCPPGPQVFEPTRFGCCYPLSDGGREDAGADASSSD